MLHKTRNQQHKLSDFIWTIVEFEELLPPQEFYWIISDGSAIFPFGLGDDAFNVLVAPIVFVTKDEAEQFLANHITPDGKADLFVRKVPCEKLRPAIEQHHKRICRPHGSQVEFLLGHWDAALNSWVVSCFHFHNYKAN